MRVALSGLTMAEYYRDRENPDVLLFGRRHPSAQAGSGGVGAAGPYARRRLSAYLATGVAGAHYLHAQGPTAPFRLLMRLRTT